MLRFALFGFRGRLNRLAWLGWQVVALLIGLVAAAAGAVVLAAGNSTHHANTALGALVFAVGTLWLLWTAAALGVKRLHDLNHSGWHLIWMDGLALLPGVLVSLAWEAGAVAGLVALGSGLWLACRPGDAERNRFGIEPVRREAARRRLAARQRLRERHDPPTLRRPTLERDGLEEDFSEIAGTRECYVPVRVERRG